MPRGCVGVAVARVVGGTGVGVAVAGGVSGVSVHPAKTVSRMMTETTRIKENFFIPCSVTSLDIIIAKYCEGSSSFYPAALVIRASHVIVLHQSKKSINERWRAGLYYLNDRENSTYGFRMGDKKPV